MKATTRGGSTASSGAIATGFDGPFFPPGTPLSPQAPSTVRGRAFDFPTGVNLNYQPRQQQGLSNIPFDTLRRFADPARGGLDLVRIAIEKRKREMKQQRFTVVTKGKKNDDGGDRGREAERMLAKPDGVTPWRNWLSAFLEDHFVIDAPTVFFRQSGDSVVMEMIDGATVDILIDDRGRTPVPPLPAYQQILKGLPAIDYTTEEIGYYLDNPRPGRLYGMSPVEQIVTTIQIALNRQLSVLNYFTAGSVPDMLIGVPKEWNPDQIAQFQEWWDSFLAGNLAERRHARFIPGDQKPYETKTEVLKGDFDEWLARLVCWCFDQSPESLVKQTNRATAQTSKESAAETGLEPTKEYIKAVVDDMLERMGGGDLELRWEDEEINDPIQKASVIMSFFGGSTGGAKKIITLDEAREMAGFPPADDKQREELEPPEPVMTPGAPGASGANPEGGGDPAAASDPSDRAAKRRGGRRLPRLPGNPEASARAQRRIAKAVRPVLTAQRDAVVAYLRGRTEKLSKATLEDLHALLAELEENPWDDDIRERIRDAISEMLQTRAGNALDFLEEYGALDQSEIADLLVQANEAAVAWSQTRVGNLITEVSTATRNGVNEFTAAAIEEGLSNAELADELSDWYGFSPERATLIARTETAFADSQGALAGYRASGVVTGKAWDPDDEACPICLGNAAQGVIDLEDNFDSGDDAPPAHPNCECSVVPVVDGEDAPDDSESE